MMVENRISLTQFVKIIYIPIVTVLSEVKPWKKTASHSFILKDIDKLSASGL